MLLFLVLAIVIIILAVSRDYKPALPRMKEQSQLYKKVLDTNRTFLFKNSLIEQYGGFRKYINEKVPYKAGAFPRTKQKRFRSGWSRKGWPKYDTNFRSFTKFPAGIRAAFYVDWDAQSFLSDPGVYRQDEYGDPRMDLCRSYRGYRFYGHRSAGLGGDEAFGGKDPAYSVQ